MIRDKHTMNYKIDNLQYCNWARKIFEINRSAGLDAGHVTIVYHEDFDALQLEIKKWEKLFHENSDLIFLGKNFQDIDKANKAALTAPSSPIASVPTGIPLGICAIDNKLSKPLSFLLSTGTPSTGTCVSADIMPGR